MFRCPSSCSHTAGCATRPNKRFWSSISLTFLWAHTKEQMWTCDMKTSLGHWRHHLASWMFYILHTITCARMSQLARFRGTFCHVACSNIWTKQDMVTYELPCAHDKCSQIARQKRVSVLVAAQARWQFCSLRHTLRACVFGKHECLCSTIRLAVVPTASSSNSYISWTNATTQNIGAT